MKRYGMNQTTEFTKKQINVVYVKAKNGELKVEKWVIEEMYELADFYGIDYNKSVERDEQTILKILETMFAGEIEECQEEIDWYTRTNYDILPRARKEAVDRSYL